MILPQRVVIYFMVTPNWEHVTDTPPHLEDLSVGSKLREVAAEVPDRIALVEASPTAERRRWTFAELLDDATRCAHYLLGHFRPGERVAVWAHNLPEWVLLQYGAALAGLTLVTVNPSLQPTEAAYILRQSRTAGLFVVPLVRGNKLADHAESIRSELPQLRHVIRLDSLQRLLADVVVADDAQLPVVGPDDHAQIQYTSGTTGFPKGAILRHGAIVHNARMCTERMGIPDNSGWLQATPLFHTSGCCFGVLSALNLRSKLVLMSIFEPAMFLELVESERTSVAGGVPTMLIAVMDHPDLRTRDLSSWRWTASGGAQVPASLVERIQATLGIDFTIIYGQTECSPVLTCTMPSDSAEDKALTVGKPLPHTMIRIVDPTTLDTVPVGSVGELWARGYFTMAGYFEDHEATSQALRSDGWLRTGDLATIDERGYCRIVGRLKDMIIRGGENLFPAEIEEVIYRHPAVSEVAVIGLPDPYWGEIVAAFVTLRDPQTVPTEGELRSHMRSVMSAQKTPARWYAVDNLPMTGSGKIQKFVLAEQWQRGQYSDRELQP
jgi:fatty-acyl-CoA synthase